MAGGCIAQSTIATFADGSRVFVKCASGNPDMFTREAKGLATLSECGAIRVPEVLAVSEDALVLELIEAGPKPAGFSQRFGRNFARLHQYRGKTCGFPHNNFIGSSNQCNTPVNGRWEQSEDQQGVTWPEFYLQRRLRFQANLATQNGYEIAQLLDNAEDRIYAALQVATEPPGLLHGDLWAGNFIVDEHGEACLIDPAVYYGHREADLAMTKLFGGFDSVFYTAYEEEFPLADGHEDRVAIYQLYHILNHLNLFGGSYLAQSIRMLKHYAA
jgi:protein-ribulosamine 3-kinase